MRSRATPSRRVFVIIAVMLQALAVGGVARADRQTIDFEDRAGITRDEYASRGVRFPRGIDIGRCQPASCVAARSGSHVARTPLAPGSELVRVPFVARFESLQSSVTFSVRNDIERPDGVLLRAMATATDDAGAVVGTMFRDLYGADDWATFTLIGRPRASGGSFDVEDEIRSIEVTLAVDGEAPDNYMAVDDLSFDGGASGPGLDTVRPLVDTLAPAFDTTATTPTIETRVRATDNVSLARVEQAVFQVFRGGGYGRLRDATICGGSSGVLCDPLVVDETFGFSLSGLPNGRYAFLASACDSAGNCAEDGPVEFTLNVPAETQLSILPHSIEVNQGVQERLNRLPRPGETVSSIWDVPIIPGKNTLVRAYLFALNRTAPGYSADLSMTFEHEGRVIGTHLLRPNTTDATIEPPLYPGATTARAAALELRPALSKTLNFLVPGNLLMGADTVEMQISRRGIPVSGRIRMPVGRPSGIGLNAYLVSYNGGPFPPETDVTNIWLPYIRDNYPVSDAKALFIRRALVADNVPFVSQACVAKEILWMAYGGDDATTGGYDYTHINPVLGAVTGLDSNGCADIGSADEPNFRHGGTGVAAGFGDTAAHEIGHILGLEHASDAHSESSGGGTEEWPYPHGAFSPPWQDLAFGMLARPKTDAPGTWQVTLIDPCPSAANFDGRRSCLDNVAVHEMMSYGGNSGVPPIPTHTTARSRWLSRVNHNRLYRAIAFGEPVGDATGSASDGAIATAADATRTEAYLLSVAVDVNGALATSRLMRKSLPTRLLSEGVSGAYELQLFDRAGSVLSSTRFDVHEVGDETSGKWLARLAVPFIAGIAGYRIVRDGAVVYAKSASPSPPAVRLLSPAPGSRITADTTIRWEASDADGDPVGVLLQYSPDGGRTWQGLGAVGPDAPQQAPLFSNELLAGDRALIRAVATDGVNTTSTVLPCLSVGTGAAPVCERVVDVKPLQCPNKMNPNEQGTLKVIVPGDDVIDARAVDVSSLRLEGVAPILHEIADRSGPRAQQTCPVPAADGRPDLILTFDANSVGAAMAPVAKGETKTLTLRGVAGGMVLIGTDAVTAVVARS